MTALEAHQPLYVPPLDWFTEDGVHYGIDGAAPNWVALDGRGRALVERIATVPGAVTAADLVTWYASAERCEAAKALIHVHDLLAGLARAGMLSQDPVSHPSYPGRLALSAPDGLAELWLQINNACNLSCTHCLVSSGPGEAEGPPADWLVQQIDAAAQLGLERLYVTGGEPFLRRDLVDLLRHAAATLGLDVIVLTNATAFSAGVRRQLVELDREQVKFQVSLDGTQAATHDRFRGLGAFAQALDGIRFLTEHDFDVSITTVVTTHNLAELPEAPALTRDLGAASYHLMWMHKRGRAAASANGFFPDVADIVRVTMETADAAEASGVPLDNVEAVKRRVNGVPGVKYDFGNAGWDSLCIFHDGKVYPSAALAGEPALVCGDLTQSDLRTMLAVSPVVHGLRAASIACKAVVHDDPLRFLTGGGDWEHAWCFSGGDPFAPDPYYPVTQALIRRVMTTLGREKRDRLNHRSGYDAPVVLHAMGEGAIACGTADGALAERPVLPLHSNCVLSFDVDKPRRAVREYYGAAAESPKADLCCPTSYDRSMTDHIPQDVLDRFYGCGSPVTRAAVQLGEMMLDLGSGAGIDVFIAAKLVGAGGRAIGIDMTDEMLSVANSCRPAVATNLGYDVVEFRKGFLEAIPVESGTVDVVTSNCVVNLSPDKPRVFAEVWRVLADHGRLVISDIVSDRPVPPHLRVNPKLWGECLVGALTEEQFMAELERAGFYGLTVQEKSFWKEVEGYAFSSVTVAGYKFEKMDGCVFQGHRAVYLGPGKIFVDEEGHQFMRNEPYEVCTDTVAKLQRPPYADMFALLAPHEDRVSYACCTVGADCC